MIRKDLQFLLKYLDDIGKVFIVSPIYILRIFLAFLVAEMIPGWCRNNEFDTVVLFLWQDLLKVLHLIDMRLRCGRTVWILPVQITALPGLWFFW